jgi:hypothetical protein
VEVRCIFISERDAESANLTCFGVVQNSMVARNQRSTDQPRGRDQNAIDRIAMDDAWEPGAFNRD